MEIRLDVSNVVAPGQFYSYSQTCIEGYMEEEIDQRELDSNIISIRRSAFTPALPPFGNLPLELY